MFSSLLKIVSESDLEQEEQQEEAICDLLILDLVNEEIWKKLKRMNMIFFARRTRMNGYWI
jgi:predicted aldo/keto reductase-like oxidoreductase